MTIDNQILFYEALDGETRIEVLHEDETVWLNQKDMATLFQKTVPTINVHIKNIYSEGELEEQATIRKFLIVQNEGKRKVSREIEHYNLDVIISVGYRVKSLRGTQFRIWATKKLKEYIVKGYVMDDDRLANGGSNYFDELLGRVRHIRTSEYNFYRKVREVFATSIDYNGGTDIAKTFFATVQNKFHYAIHGHTAAELVIKRIGSDKSNLGLTNWRGKIVTLKDALIAKNYLEELEIKRLELLVEQFLSFAELRTVEQKAMYMNDWIKKLDGFIKLNEMEILLNSGVVSRKKMETRVREEYENYREKIIAEEALSEGEFAQRLENATANLIQSGADDMPVKQGNFYDVLDKSNSIDEE